jgi:hypothetical protein
MRGITATGRRAVGGVLALAALPACATLGMLGIQPLRIQADRDRPAELRLAGGFGALPTSATLRMWARVENPNPIGVTLSSIEGSAFLDDARAGALDLPLGLPLEARMEEVVPLDVTIRFSELPGLGRVVARAVRGEPIGYRLEGRFGVDAGQFGTPTFGPMTLLRGEVRPFR